MKKYISLFSFLAIFFIGMQSQAQESRVVEAESPEAIAKQKTYELHKAVNLTGDQQRETFKILVDLQQNYKGLKSNDDIASVQKAKAALMEKTNERLKVVLTAEQYEIYLKSEKSEKLEKSKK